MNASITAACSMLLASCSLTPGDYTPATDSTAFGPHSFLQNMYYCGSDAQNHYFAREMRPWWASTHYFKIDRTLAKYTPEKPFSSQRSQWDHVTSPPHFPKAKPSAWPISRPSSSPTASSSPKNTN